MARPVGSMKPFWLPVTATSTPHSSMRKSMQAIELTPSTRSSAGCFAASIALRTAATSERTPVAVSLWVTRTALISWSLSASSAAWNSAAGAPAPQGALSCWTSRPCRLHMSIQRCENMPWRQARILSPGDRVLEIAASQPAVPVAGNMMTSPALVFRTSFTPANSGLNIVPKLAERWSIVGTLHAWRSRSGMLVGPGMKTGFWLDMGVPSVCLCPSI